MSPWEAIEIFLRFIALWIVERVESWKTRRILLAVTLLLVAAVIVCTAMSAFVWLKGPEWLSSLPDVSFSFFPLAPVQTTGEGVKILLHVATAVFLLGSIMLLRFIEVMDAEEGGRDW